MTLLIEIIFRAFTVTTFDLQLPFEFEIYASCELKTSNQSHLTDLFDFQ